MSLIKPVPVNFSRKCACDSDGCAIWADAGYLGQKLLAAVQQLIPNRGLRIQIVKRSDLHRHSFEILPRRWVVERTFAWLSFSRRLAKDYEVKTDHSRAFIFIASSRIMLKRLTR